MLMCQEATRLMSLKQDRRLTFRERVSLRFHLSMCGACRECDRQFDLLHQAGDRYQGGASQSDSRDRKPSAAIDSGRRDGE